MRRIACILAIVFLLTGRGVNVQLQPQPNVTGPAPTFGYAWGYSTAGHIEGEEVDVNGPQFVQHQGIHINIVDPTDGVVYLSKNYADDDFAVGHLIHYSDTAIDHCDLYVYAYDNHNPNRPTEWLILSRYNPSYPSSGLPGHGPVV